MKALVCISFLLLLTGIGSVAQTPVFSQYYSSGLYLNPALAGLEKDVYMGMNYRSQWSNIGLPFSTFQFSFIQPITRPGTRVKHMGGFGTSFLNDVAGPNKEFTTQAISVAAAYNFHLSRYGNNVVAVGIQGGASQQRLNYDALQWSSQYSPGMGFDNALTGEASILNTQVWSPTFNAGAMWHYTTRGRMASRSSSAFAGLSVSNILRTRGFVEDTRGARALLYKLHGGFISLWKRKYEVSPNYLVQYQNASFQVNVGTYISYYLHPPHLHNSKSTKVFIGVWYRLQDAFILSAGFSNTNWNLGFSYDTNISSMGRSLGYANAYEVSLAYKIVLQKGFRKFSSPLI